MLAAAPGRSSLTQYWTAQAGRTRHSCSSRLAEALCSERRLALCSGASPASATLSSDGARGACAGASDGVYAARGGSPGRGSSCENTSWPPCMRRNDLMQMVLTLSQHRNYVPQ